MYLYLSLAIQNKQKQSYPYAMQYEQTNNIYKLHMKQNLKYLLP